MRPRDSLPNPMVTNWRIRGQARKVAEGTRPIASTPKNWKNRIHGMFLSRIATDIA